MSVCCAAPRRRPVRHGDGKSPQQEAVHPQAQKPALRGSGGPGPRQWGRQSTSQAARGRHPGFIRDRNAASGCQLELGGGYSAHLWAACDAQEIEGGHVEGLAPVDGHLHGSRQAHAGEVEHAHASGKNNCPGRKAQHPPAAGRPARGWLLPSRPPAAAANDFKTASGPRAATRWRRQAGGAALAPSCPRRC